MEAQPLGPLHATPDAIPTGPFGHSRDLWREAPAWRVLVCSTAALLVASVATGFVSQWQGASSVVAALPPTISAERSLVVAPAAAPQTAPAPALIPKLAPAVPPSPPAATAPSAPVAPQPLPIAPREAAIPPQPTPLWPQAARPIAPPDVPSAPSLQGTVCNYRGGGGGGGQGRVVGFLTREQAGRLLALTQQRARARINPDYVGNVRVVITAPDGHRVIALQPSGLVVKPGDRVAFTSGHRDWSMACGYIPNLIIGLLQPQ